MTTFHMETDIVRNMVSQLKQGAESFHFQTQAINSSAQSVDWLGPSRDEFVMEMEAVIHQMESQIEAGTVLAGRVENEVAEWETISTRVVTGSGSIAAIIAVIRRVSNSSNSDQARLDSRFVKFETPQTDPGGVVLYPENEIIANMFGQREITATEKRLLDQLNPVQLLKFFQISKGALAIAQKFSNDPEDLNGGVSDAFRHIYWNAQLTREFGADWAKQYTDVHEGIPGNIKASSFMDLSNNSTGIELAKNNPGITEQELVNKITDLVKTGKAIIIDPKTQTPLYSNQHPDVVNFSAPSVDGYSY